MNNITVASQSHFFLINSIKDLSFTDSTFRNVSSTDDTDVDSSAMSISQVNLDTSGDFMFSNLTFEEYSLSILKINSFVNTPPTLKEFLFANMYFSNSYFASPRSIILTERLVYDLDVNFVFLNLTFSSITFAQNGYLMSLKHQLPHSVTITNSTFSNIQRGKILVEATKVQNKELLAKVTMRNTIFNNIDQLYGSFIEVYEGGELSINDCSFTNMYTFFRGAVLSVGYQNAQVFIHNTAFKNNSAFEGGVFNIEAGSVVECHNCTISHNFAVTSTVAYVSSSGHYQFYSSTLTQNYANSNPISLLQDNFIPSIVDSSKVYDNFAMSKQDILNEFSNSCSSLCFVSQGFMEHAVSSFASLINESPNHYLIQLVYASLSISNNTEIYNQTSLINAFLSSVSISDSHIHDIELTGIGMQIVSSELRLSNMSISRIVNNINTDFILAISGSNVIMSETVYSDSQSILLKTRASQVDINGLKVFNITEAVKLLHLTSAYSSTIHNINVNSTSVSSGYLVDITNSDILSIKDIKINRITSTVFSIVNSNITEVLNISIVG